MDAGSLKPGDRVRVKFPGYWAHNRIVVIAEGSREYGLPIKGPNEGTVCVIGPDQVVPV